MTSKRDLLRDLTPPLLWRSASWKKHLRARSREIVQAEDSSLFDGENELFKMALENTQVYGEYGVGQSTIWVRKNTQVRMICADSDVRWIEMVKKNIQRKDDIEMLHIDIGPLSTWGRPRGYGQRDKFPNYPKALWSFSVSPDTVLIDGRFRVSCFLTTVLHAESSTRIIFDDYVGRAEYSVVEEIIRPEETNKRQALFVLPDKKTINIAKTEELLSSFWLVTE